LQQPAVLTTGGRCNKAGSDGSLGIRGDHHCLFHTVMHFLPSTLYFFLKPSLSFLQRRLLLTWSLFHIRCIFSHEFLLDQSRERWRGICCRPRCMRSNWGRLLMCPWQCPSPALTSLCASSLFSVSLVHLSCVSLCPSPCLSSALKACASSSSSCLSLSLCVCLCVSLSVALSEFGRHKLLRFTLPPLSRSPCVWVCLCASIFL
jgi:hypothetical protein